MDKDKIKYKFVFATCYGIALVLFTLYILLDSFVIERKYAVVEEDSLSYAYIPQNVEITDSSYKDDNIEINITKIRECDANIYIADIVLNDPKFLKTAFAKNTYGLNIIDTTSNIAENHNAIFAINGDFYGFRKKGYVLRNGVIYRKNKQSIKEKEDLIIYEDGTFEVKNEQKLDLEAVKKSGAWQVFSFGPGVIQNGLACINEKDDFMINKNPRTAIGIIDNLHYMVVVTDGRVEGSIGLTLIELAELFKRYGAIYAYNLDGGGSSSMWFQGKLLNSPSNGVDDFERSVSDIVYIGY